MSPHLVRGRIKLKGRLAGSLNVALIEVVLDSKIVSVDKLLLPLIFFFHHNVFIRACFRSQYFPTVTTGGEVFLEQGKTPLVTDVAF